jgi:ribulose-phosphate 3-epimerase
MTVKISPSILAADFSRLAEEAALIADDADLLHVDVMDNNFVPNLTVGLPVVESLVKNVSLPLDCHLGIADPDRWAASFAEVGAHIVTIHAEAVKAPIRTLRAIRAAGGRAGLALNPATPIEPYEELLEEIDVLLIMTIEPGFGGQRFMEAVLPKIRRARQAIDSRRVFGRELPLWLQVDGGINAETICKCAKAGADVFVAGSSVFQGEDPATVVRDLRTRAEMTRSVVGHC